MAFKYEKIVPWGRSYQEYLDMFHLTEDDLNKSILGCGDGPASFNSVMNRDGKKIVSVDPIYQFSAGQIEQRITETYQTVIGQTMENKDKFNWDKVKNVEELGQVRMAAMKEFLLDFENGKKEMRYIFAELPILPFKDNEFDLSLCSHLLFLYTDNLTLQFHIQSITEMLRVSKEIRIFPLLDVNSNISQYLPQIVDKFSNEGYLVQEIQVNYEFQKGGNLMLRITQL